MATAATTSVASPLRRAAASGYTAHAVIRLKPSFSSGSGPYMHRPGEWEVRCLPASGFTSVDQPPLHGQSQVLARSPIDSERPITTYGFEFTLQVGEFWGERAGDSDVGGQCSTPGSCCWLPCSLFGFCSGRPLQDCVSLCRPEWTILSSSVLDAEADAKITLLLHTFRRLLTTSHCCL